MSWFALYVMPCAERRVIDRLREDGRFQAFFPTMEVRLRRKLSNGSTKLVWTARPLFSRYVFVQSSAFGFLVNLPGVAAVVAGAEGQPTEIPEPVIEFIRNRKQEPIDLTVLGWEARLGDSVAVAENSPLYGLVGEIAGLSRLESHREVEVWLTMLGARRRVRVPASGLTTRCAAAVGEQALLAA